LENVKKPGMANHLWKGRGQVTLTISLAGTAEAKALNFVHR